ncbi:hypothetical protein [Novosphingobium sp. ST904]|nr:hypothetical protein [Novosphingobium sp. ST904]TCM39143.1 hypothetical protein EDF59_10622 [Novosphingobium sp. ST904]
MAVIKVLRDYCGEEGTDVDKNVFADSKHTVTRARAAALFASGLVEIVSDEAHPDDDKDSEAVAEGKNEPEPITSKPAPKPRNKSVAKAADKQSDQA